VSPPRSLTVDARRPANRDDVRRLEVFAALLIEAKTEITIADAARRRRSRRTRYGDGALLDLVMTAGVRDGERRAVVSVAGWSGPVCRVEPSSCGPIEREHGRM